MNMKISVPVIWVEVIIYLLLYNSYDCTFKNNNNATKLGINKLINKFVHTDNTVTVHCTKNKDFH